ncbi:MAG: hypothetical protein AAGC68_05535 [Verrucomicrobiota bacterium]
MKASLLALLALLAATPLFSADETVKGSGLIVREYPRHVDQDDEDDLYVEPKRFGKPIGDPYLIKSLQGWKHGTDRNAIASGFLLIEKKGVYEFRTNSYYDRSQLRIDDKIICHFQDGTDRVKRARLEEGFRRIESIGFVASRGETVGVTVEWRPPGQREFGTIPPRLLHTRDFSDPQTALRKEILPQGSPYEKKSEKGGRFPVPNPPVATGVIAKELTLVAKDFVIEIYHNGRRLRREERKMVLDRFGATAEKVRVEVMPGDWLVFHVAVNRLRHGGSRYFGVTGHRDDGQVGFTSRVSEAWSSCDHPALSHDFTHLREAGTESRVVAIEKEWHEGKKFMEQYSGTKWTGDAIWGSAASTWLKFRVPKIGLDPVVVDDALPPGIGRIVIGEGKTGSGIIRRPPGREKEAPTSGEVDEEASEPTEPEKIPLAITQPRRWPVQVISAIYGTGGKNADVTEKVRQFVEVEQAFFAANPKYLGVDPNPYWNKGLRIIYLKDGVQRVQRRNENEHILPESFYGPQDTAELARWIEGTRWQGPRGEVQFHPNGKLAGSGLGGEGDWKSLGPNRLEIRWPKAESATEYRFDYVWSSFRVPDDGQDEYRIVK